MQALPGEVGAIPGLEWNTVGNKAQIKLINKKMAALGLSADSGQAPRELGISLTPNGGTRILPKKKKKINAGKKCSEG